MKYTIDIDLITRTLRDCDHAVGPIVSTPDHAGEAEIEVDGGLLSLVEARALLAQALYLK